MDQLLPMAVFSPAPTNGAEELEPKDHQTQGKLFSLVSARAGANGHAYTIQVAQDRSVDEQFEKQFGLLVAAVLRLRDFCLGPDRDHGDETRFATA